MRSTSLTVTGALALAFFLGGTGVASAADCANADATLGTATPTELQVATVCLINEARANEGLDPVAPHASLTAASGKYASRMVAQRFFAQVSPAGSTTARRAKTAGYTKGFRGWIVGENIGQATGDASSPQAVVDAWLQDPDSSENVLGDAFEDIGVGITAGAPTATGSVAATYSATFGVRRKLAIELDVLLSVS